MELKTIAEVSSGYTFRERLEAFPKGDTAVIQMKNIDTADRLLLEDVPCVLLPGLSERQHLKPGDLILRARGLFHTVALVTESLANAVAAAPLMVIRITSRDVVPAYLRWFINLPSTQATLLSLAAGSHVRTLNKVAVENLDISVPAPERQQHIAQLAELGEREKVLAMKIAKKKSQLLEEILAQCAQR